MTRPAQHTWPAPCIWLPERQRARLVADQRRLLGAMACPRLPAAATSDKRSDYRNWARKPPVFSRGMIGPSGLRSVLKNSTINMEYKHEGHNIHLVVYHIIWCPKRRRKVLVGPVRDRLEHLINEL